MTVRVAVALLVSLLSGPVLVAGTEMLDERDGFRDLKFGMELEAVSGLSPVEGEGEDSTWYVRESDSMTLGTATLTSIRYNSYKGQLAAVHLTATYSNCDALLNTLREAYGRGTKTSPLVKRSWWMGDLVSMSYQRIDEAECEVYILSKPILDQKDADEKSETKTVTGGS